MAVGGFPVVTLCGSTKFKDDFLKAQKELTLEGNIVLTPFIFSKSGDNISKKDIDMLTEMHDMKISISDEIYVINTDGYIGKSTKREIEIAKKLNLRIRYMYPYRRGDLN